MWQNILRPTGQLFLSIFILDPEEDYNRFISGLGGNDKLTTPYAPVAPSPISMHKSETTNNVNEPEIKTSGLAPALPPAPK